MRNKKLLSTVVATAMIATMAMPVMAADGGSIDVPVTTKTAIIRVQVPTKMEISVNQFEMGDSGSQIYATDFTMENKSEIPVKVNVTSTAELKATTKLVDTKAAAVESTKEGEVWMAVAAKTGAASYADGTATAVADLTESNRNVTTFVQGTETDATKGTASQMFYLNKSDTMAYKLLNTSEDASEIDYAQFYELTPETVADANALAALIADKEIYVATAAAADGQSLEKVAKGGNHAFSATEKYYTATAEATAKASIDSTKLYVYGDGSVDTAGTAAFRYIGKLSGGQETWTKADITKVTIKYDITGVQDSKYTAESANCVYGLYKDPAAAPSIATTNYTMEAGKELVISVNLGAGSKKATGISKVMYGDFEQIGGGFASYADGKLTLTSANIDFLMSQTGVQKLTVIFNDTAETSVEITLQ